MLDIKLLREDIHAVATALLKRGYEIDSARFQALEDKRKALQTKTQGLQNQRNERSKAIGQAKSQGQDIQPLLAEVADLGEQLKLAETDLSGLQAQIHDFVSGIPNLLHDSVPEGKDEADNIEIKRWGEQPQFDFEIKDHVDLGGRDQQMDFEAATRITGSRFVVLKKDIARMHRALIQLMLDSHINEHQYEEVYVPYIVNSNSLYGTGQLPKFADDLFKLNAEQEFYLIPTAEVPVTNLVSDSIVDESSLPLKYTAHTPCFRSEAGSYGRDTRGLIRQHQFEKVEMVQLVKPDDSWQALESMLGHAEAILQKLQLPYRVVTLCAGDTGFSSSKTYDIEVWLPAQEAYREISSVSNMQDFQARRMQARYRNKDNNKPELLHSLNGSGLAVGRTLLAILENHQQADGSVRVPEVLQPYMGGVDRILIEH